MVLKDAEYIKRNIFAIFYKHESLYLDRPYYRFVGEQEFETLIKDNILYFTNPVEWKISNTGDEKETYFEGWFTDRKNITKAYELIRKKTIERQKQYCTQQSITALYSGFVAAATLLQQKNFCYCITDTFTNAKMIEEYHTKYKRNIIIKFKKDFYKKIAMLDKGDFSPSNITYLYADVMPMMYVNDFDDFIEKCIYECNSFDEIAKNVFDYGAFLKHISYSYEKETRIKLRMYLENECNLQYLAREFYIDNFDIQDDNRIIEKSMEFIEKNKSGINSAFEDVRDRIKDIGGKECFELVLDDVCAKDIVDQIILHTKVKCDEKEHIHKLAGFQRIAIKEIDFDGI